ncbi:ATP-binding protein [Salinibacterium sp. UTAS2018]|uniref:sensor histidine kinase n=1 Tax=Salinibacterium sp. UTAS2018 TaxID=2508880 RepID=UPI0010096927|nr:ATP-binding protein [Salinibacterium sp. UTAS2018]QAV71141.1 ATP-binding protein [Salinibacterium sp. UTAS2018]
MSIGLPAHLRKESVSRALARTINTIAFVCFSIALLAVLSLQASDMSLNIWPAALALVPMLVTVSLVNRFRTPYFTVAHLVIGAPAIYWFTLIVVSELSPLGPISEYLLNLPTIGLMLVGGAASTVAWSLLWITLGLIASQGAFALAAWQLTGDTPLSPAAYIVFVAVLAVLFILRSSQRGVRRVQSHLHRAARDDEFASLRYGIEATSAAVMHDTVLSHLAAIANAPYGAMNEKLQREIKRDLEVLIGEEWLSSAASDEPDDARFDWQGSPLYTAISEARALELAVEVTGDLAALSRLDARGSAALGPAVKQCLLNVIKHSGTMQAEVAVFGSPDEVSVLVVDSGKGFHEAETGEDRLGLRQSVRRRIELVSGTVQVWSTPGFGTSVMIRVPTSESQPALAGGGVE